MNTQAEWLRCGWLTSFFFGFSKALATIFKVLCFFQGRSLCKTCQSSSEIVVLETNILDGAPT